MIDKSRFDRNYLLIIEVEGQEIQIAPPIKVVFDVQKSIFGGLNKMSLQVFNLSESKRLKLVKDKEEKKNIKYKFYAGYKGSENNKGNLELLFSGSIYTGGNERQGADIVTSIESLDGGFDFINSITSKVIRPGADSSSEIIKDLPNTEKGKILESKNLTRPKVLHGNSINLIKDQLNPGETWYIENGIINIIKEENTVSSIITTVNAKSGLISTPTRDSERITFLTMMNPSVKIGERVDLQSVTAPHMNGIYRVETMSISGDNYGENWTQQVTGSLFNGEVL